MVTIWLCRMCTTPRLHQYILGNISRSYWVMLGLLCRLLTAAAEYDLIFISSALSLQTGPRKCLTEIMMELTSCFLDKLGYWMSTVRSLYQASGKEIQTKSPVSSPIWMSLSSPPNTRLLILCIHCGQQTMQWRSFLCQFVPRHRVGSVFFCIN